jgi:hypothetical protein
MKTFEPCQQTLFDETELQLTPSVAASPAKTLAMLESALALKVKGLVCGESTGDLLARYDPASSSWRTSQACLVSGWEPFSETFPRSGMTLSGIAYQLAPSAPLTGGTGSGLLPTPRANDAEKRGEIANDARNGLPAAAKYWPTPRQSDHKGAVTATNTTKRRMETGQANLPEAVVEAQRMWPTPRASEFKGTGPVGSKSHAHRLKKGYLDATVLQFPTPRAQSARGSGPSRVGNKADLQTVVGGSLNADWTEWLMGFPIGWTQVLGWKNPKASRASSKGKSTAPTD